MLGVVTSRRQVGGLLPEAAPHLVDVQRSRVVLRLVVVLGPVVVPRPAVVPRWTVVPRPAFVLHLGVGLRLTVGLRLADVLGSADGSRSVAALVVVVWLAWRAQGSRPPRAG